MILQNKIAFITGGGRGIGRAIALEIAREGANIAVTDINLADAKSVIQEIKNLGRQANAYEMDVSNLENVEKTVSQCVKDFGKIDILVNNAGWDKIIPFLQSDPALWNKIIDINYKGVLNCTKTIGLHMAERGYGRIVNIASDAAKVGSSGEAVYAGTKGAIVAFTKTIARELVRNGINANCVCPGPTETPLFAEISGSSPKLAEALKKAIPKGRLGTPEDIAMVVAFLASDKSEYITGQAISVSGGLTMC